MDTKPLEEQAESYVRHTLLKYEFLVTKPTFDQEGTDLLIVNDIRSKTTPFIRVQCKGRMVSTGSNVTIPKDYVDENFIVFLYVIKKESKDHFLYVYFQEDIEKWTDAGNTYRLYINRTFDEDNSYKERLFNKLIVPKIKNILLKQTINQQVKVHDSIIVDGIFLERAVKKTRQFYMDMYPNKKLVKPYIDDLIVQICRYTHLQLKKELTCYLIYSSHHALEEVVEIGEVSENSFFTGTINRSVGKDFNLYKLKTDQIISFKIEEQLERLINTENVLLVADDPAYIPYLDDLKARGVEIKIAQLKGDLGSRMYHRFRYADISYPIAECIGIDKFDL